MVIMGSSGAGKTTLLDILACNLFGGGAVGGQVLVNGEPRRRSQFSQIACYVMQRGRWGCVRCGWVCCWHASCQGHACDVMQHAALQLNTRREVGPALSPAAQTCC